MNPAKKKLIALDPNSTIARASLLMGKLKCQALPVALGGEIVGILTLEDIESLVNSYTAGKVRSTGLMVGNFMKSPVKPVDSSRDLSTVVRSMLENKAQAVVIKEGEEILGVLSRENLLELLAQLSEKTKSTVLDSLQELSHEKIE
jgi:predicted transcriptional regulator